MNERAASIGRNRTLVSRKCALASYRFLEEIERKRKKAFIASGLPWT
jgi:hypothetical protein